jgi:GDPmannose 4,6-dehydratase
MAGVALITGITGQDGSYLAELLLQKGYEVHGLVRRLSGGFNTKHISHILNDITMHYSDLTDGANVKNILLKVKPDEVYNLAAQSHVGVSFEVPVFTAEANAVGVLHILEAVRSLAKEKHVKFYQASTSELFGKVFESPQTENTPFYPRSPYGAAKLYGYWITVNYRESYDLFACNGILFNHESPRRGPEFVTRKIVIGMIRQHLGLQESVKLGNLNAMRDWGHAKDFVRAMWLMLQKDKPDDYIIATNTEHSVRKFCEEVAKHLEYIIIWQGEGLNEVGINAKTGKVVIEVAKEFYRPAEVTQLLGDYTKAKNELAWFPTYTFEDLVFDMCEHEMRAQKNGF